MTQEELPKDNESIDEWVHRVAGDVFNQYHQSDTPKAAAGTFNNFIQEVEAQKKQELQDNFQRLQQKAEESRDWLISFFANHFPIFYKSLEEEIKVAPAGFLHTGIENFKSSSKFSGKFGTPGLIIEGLIFAVYGDGSNVYGDAAYRVVVAKYNGLEQAADFGLVMSEEKNREAQLAKVIKLALEYQSYKAETSIQTLREY